MVGTPKMQEEFFGCPVGARQKLDSRPRCELS